MDISAITSMANQYTKESSSASKLEETLKSDYAQATDDELMDVCKEFEQYFVEQVFKEMRKTIPQSESKSSYTSTMKEYFEDSLYQPNSVSNTPAATAEPITPATLGPIACISRKLAGFAFCPSTWETRAAIGTAETPAEPIRGLILPFVTKHIILPVIRPPQVEMQNATSPRAIINKVWGFKKFSAFAVAPTETPRNMVTIFISSFCAVLEILSVTPHTLRRLPNIRNPIRGAASGTIIATTTVTIMGNSRSSVLDTGRSAVITISRSFFVVSILIKGG